MVMELVDGPNLADVLRAGPLPWRRALATCADVAAGLAATHAMGLVHHDVKPGNVMLGTTGAKLVDFGISAELGEPSEPAPDGSVLGTPAYVSPERLRGGPASPAADVYALGLLLYRALTGRLPWDVTNRDELLRAHLLCEPAPLPHLRGVPDSVGDLLRRCLSKDPDERPAAAELVGELRRAAQERRRLPGVIPVLFGHTARARFLSIGALVATGLLLGGTVVRTPDQPLAAAAWRSRPPVPATATTPAASCQVTYQVTRDDGRRFAGTLTLRNTGTNPIPAATLGFTVPGDQALKGVGARWTQKGPQVAVPAPALDPGGMHVLQFRGTYHGANPLPMRFSLGTATCAPILLSTPPGGTAGGTVGPRRNGATP